MLAGVLIAALLVVGGLWWYHSGATCRSARSVFKYSLQAVTSARADFASHANGSPASDQAQETDTDTINTQTQYLDNVVRQNPSCFSVAVRAVVGDGS